MTSTQINNALEKIEAKSKIYENLSTRADPHYESCLRAVAIIVQFIKDRKLIIYGGTAMDYALRLHGDQIYPDEMLSVPDLDFYSPDSVRDAYELADALFAAGFENSRAIGATYVTTMRVDIADNHFLADISYIPPEVFASLPYIEYDGMRIIDPIFQKIDIHSSLSFPYDNPPREVIFARWRKDISRYNKLHQYYPTPKIKGKYIKPDVISFQYRDNVVFAGTTAYSIICTIYRNIMESIPIRLDKSKMAPAAHIFHFNVDPKTLIASCDAHNGTLHLVSADVCTLISEMQITDAEFYAAYINIMNKRIEGNIAGKSKSDDSHVRVHVIDTRDSYIGVHRVYIDNEGKIPVVFTSVQHVLMQFLAHAHLALAVQDNDRAHTYYELYESLLDMIHNIEMLFSRLPKDSPNVAGLIKNSPFFPTIDIYGNDNLSPAYKLGYNRTLANLQLDADIIKTPLGYHPSRGHAHPKFEYSESPYFTKDGHRVEMKK